MILSAWWCKWIEHSGSIVSTGKIKVTCKKNMPGGSVVIPGRWWVRKCDRCGETFSHSYDIVQKETDDHAGHVTAHLDLMRLMEKEKIQIRRHNNFFMNVWLNWRHGPRFVTLKEYWADAYKAIEKHIPDHMRLIKKFSTEK